MYKQNTPADRRRSALAWSADLGVTTGNPDGKITIDVPPDGENPYFDPSAALNFEATGPDVLGNLENIHEAGHGTGEPYAVRDAYYDHAAHAMHFRSNPEVQRLLQEHERALQHDNRPAEWRPFPWTSSDAGDADPAATNGDSDSDGDRGSDEPGEQELPPFTI